MYAILDFALQLTFKASNMKKRCRIKKKTFHIKKKKKCFAIKRSFAIEKLFAIDWKSSSVLKNKLCIIEKEFWYFF